jgi:hypothetical protein
MRRSSYLQRLTGQVPATLPVLKPLVSPFQSGAPLQHVSTVSTDTFSHTITPATAAARRSESFGTTMPASVERLVSATTSAALSLTGIRGELADPGPSGVAVDLANNAKAQSSDEPTVPASTLGKTYVTEIDQPARPQRTGSNEAVQHRSQAALYRQPLHAVRVQEETAASNQPRSLKARNSGNQDSGTATPPGQHNAESNAYEHAMPLSVRKADSLISLAPAEPILPSSEPARVAAVPEKVRPPLRALRSEPEVRRGVHIGTLEVRILPSTPPVNIKPPQQPRSSLAGPLSRNFISAIGLTQS